MSSSSPPNPNKLTTHLLSLHPEAFTQATQTPFLSHAGAGTLSKDVLQKWLAQDRLYAQAYIRFAALLLANVGLKGRVDAEAFEERLLDLILSSITNVRRELKFFEDVAKRYDLSISSSSSTSSISKDDEEQEGVSEGVRLYRKLFFEVGEAVENGSMGILEGMVLLWGTEVCYLTAWRYAASCCSSSSTSSSAGIPPGKEADGGALRKEFIPNWTSDEFAAFVDDIAVFVDVLWEKEGEIGEEKKEKKRERVEGIWKRVLDVERVFWPVVEQ